MRPGHSALALIVFTLCTGAAFGQHVHPQEQQAAPDRWVTTWHGYAFLIFNRQAGPSGDRAFESVNHLMLVSSRRWLGGEVSLLGTFTAEPATLAPEGSPELFQRGETYKGDLLVDLQHPHDLFVQLGAAWRRPLSDRTSFRAYLAPWGEPAVGPTAYPHRLSASEIPVAPLSHHSQDSTHISANVITLGVELGPVTIEGSAFHGREPDERRWDIDWGPVDSFAGRITWRPGGPLDGLSVQASAARREEPEELEEGNQTRQTVSAEWVKRSGRGFLAAALIVGRNLLPEDQTEWGSGLEATWKFLDRNYLFGRVETFDRDLFELINKTLRPETVAPDPVGVQAGTFGYTREFPLHVNDRSIEAGLGAAATFYRYDRILEDLYGDFPVSAQLFVRFRGGSAAAPGHTHH